MTPEQIRELITTIFTVLAIPVILYGLVRYIILEYRGYKN